VYADFAQRRSPSRRGYRPLPSAGIRTVGRGVVTEIGARAAGAREQVLLFYGSAIRRRAARRRRRRNVKDQRVSGAAKRGLANHGARTRRDRLEVLTRHNRYSRGFPRRHGRECRIATVSLRAPQGSRQRLDGGPLEQDGRDITMAQRHGRWAVRGYGGSQPVPSCA